LCSEGDEFPRELTREPISFCERELSFSLFSILSSFSFPLFDFPAFCSPLPIMETREEIKFEHFISEPRGALEKRDKMKIKI